MKLKKDGTPRKPGSGRTKGASSLVSVKLKDLTAKFNEDDLIVCGRIFLRNAGLVDVLPKIEAPLPEDARAGIQQVV